MTTCQDTRSFERCQLSELTVYPAGLPVSGSTGPGYFSKVGVRGDSMIYLGWLAGGTQ